MPYFPASCMPDGLIEAFRAIGEPTSAVADALDKLGIVGVLGSTALRGSINGACLVGRALTLRNVPRQAAPATLPREVWNGMAELEAHNLAEPDDVIVIEGVSGASNMGGIAARIGLRQGEAGAIVAGGVRDIAESRRIGYPIWSSEVVPLTGKWRVETVEINGSVDIHGIRVEPGDLVVADDSGVCFVPRQYAAEVLSLALAKSEVEQKLAAEVASGLSVPELAGVRKRKSAP